MKFFKNIKNNIKNNYKNTENFVFLSIMVIFFNIIVITQIIFRIVSSYNVNVYNGFWNNWSTLLCFVLLMISFDTNVFVTLIYQTQKFFQKNFPKTKNKLKYLLLWILNVITFGITALVIAIKCKKQEKLLNQKSNAR